MEGDDAMSTITATNDEESCSDTVLNPLTRTCLGL